MQQPRNEKGQFQTINRPIKEELNYSSSNIYFKKINDHTYIRSWRLTENEIDFIIGVGLVVGLGFIGRLLG